MIIINNFMIEDLKLKGNELLVYGEIATNLNEAGEFQKTYKTIAKDTGLCKRTVERVLIALNDKKLINIKRVKDGRPYVVNIITINTKHVGLITDKYFKAIIDLWRAYVGTNEDVNQQNYNAYCNIFKTPAFDLGKLRDAIIFYAQTLHDKEYYKSHVYKFDKFTKIWKDYSDGGAEKLGYEAWKKKVNTNRFTISDGPYNAAVEESSLVPDDELGSVEM